MKTRDVCRRDCRLVGQNVMYLITSRRRSSGRRVKRLQVELWTIAIMIGSITDVREEYKQAAHCICRWPSHERAMGPGHSFRSTKDRDIVPKTRAKTKAKAEAKISQIGPCSSRKIDIIFSDSFLDRSRSRGQSTSNNEDVHRTRRMEVVCNFSVDFPFSSDVWKTLLILQFGLKNGRGSFYVKILFSACLLPLL